eukprot:5713887-Ditylum_brightwellii.AAC.1
MSILKIPIKGLRPLPITKQTPKEGRAEPTSPTIAMLEKIDDLQMKGQNDNGGVQWVFSLFCKLLLIPTK